MRIGLISQWYEPEPGAAAHPTAIARALASRGHDVKVLTGFPSYPNGKVHEGYSMSWRMRESVDGIELLRIADFPSHDQSAFRRALSLTSFALSASINVGWLREVDVCLVYLTPATVGLAGRILQATAGVPYVLYVQDLWPESIAASGILRSPRIGRWVENGVNRFLSAVYRRAAGVAAISEGMADILRDRGAPDPTVVYNWVDEGVFKPCEGKIKAVLDPSRTWIMYAGGIGYSQGLETAISAMERIRVSHPEVSLAIVGDGVARPSLEAQARELGLIDRIAFLGRRPMRSMPDLMNEARAQLVSLRDLPLFGLTVPSKIQASMASAQPLICAVAGDAAELVKAADAGWCATPGAVNELAEVFAAVAEMSAEEVARKGWRGREFYLENLGSDAGASRLEALLLRACGSR